MRHRVAHRKLGRVTEHRIAMLRSQASALIEHEHLQTTVAKAKELRPFVEHIITVAKRSLSAASGSSHHVNARRMVAREVDSILRRGDKPEWQHNQDYWAEKDEFPSIDLKDRAFAYE